jgi:hypothetical protein
VLAFDREPRRSFGIGQRSVPPKRGGVCCARSVRDMA